jgi:hypothetical protein
VLCVPEALDDAVDVERLHSHLWLIGLLAELGSMD